CQKYNNSPLTF
nr:immunoglobulin light chain junction region [Macaca mulatta]